MEQFEQKWLVREIVKGFAKVEENIANLTTKEHDPYSRRSPLYLALPTVATNNSLHYETSVLQQ